MQKHLFFIHLYIFAFESSCALHHDSVRIHTYKRLDLLYANDVYNGTDRYLTQYIQLKFSSPFRITGRKSIVQSEFLLQQNVYTPSDIFGDTIQRGDRPYSSILSATYGRHKFVRNCKYTWYWQAGIGIIGRHGYGEDMQREIHYAADSRQALGWQYQVKDAAFVQGQVGIKKGILVTRYLDYVLDGQIQTGTVFNDAGIGQTLRIHLHEPCFAYLNTATKRSFRFYAEMRNQFKAVAYNGTLQGAIGSRNNPYVLRHSQINTLVYHTEFSISFAYHQFGMAVSQSFLSKEFTSGRKHRWSHLVLSYLWR